MVRLVSRLPARGDIAGGGGVDRASSTTSSTSAPPTDTSAEDRGVERVVQLSAFGRQHQLRLRPATGLLNKELKVFVAEQGNGTDVDYTELHHVSKPLP